MTIFESIKAKNIDEFTKWMKEFCDGDFAPWWQHYDKTYCKKCKPIFDKGDEYSYCELNDKCRFFMDMDYVPDVEQTIKIWLESEYN